jgi:BlaI family transcriptional regulator, penicillinase repressor
MRKTSPLTPAEFELLEVIWSRGDSSVREVWELAGPRRGLAYTTVMTVLDKMRRKGVLSQRKKGKAHIYAPLLTREEALRAVVRHVAESYFGSSTTALARTAADTPELPEPAAQPEPARSEHPSESRIDEFLL